MPGIGIGISPIFIQRTPSGGGTGFEQQTILFMTATQIPNDATVYFPATIYEITGSEYWIYVNDLFKNLKGIGNVNPTYNLLPLILALYPLIGGTSNTIKYNAIDPRDADDAFRLTLFGGLSITGEGVVGNTSNGYMKTHLIPSVDLFLNDVHICSVVRNTGGQQPYTMGAFNASLQGIIIRKSNISSSMLDNYANASFSVVEAGITYFGLISRLSSINFDFYDSKTKTNIVKNSAALPSVDISLLGYNNDGAVSGFNDAVGHFYSIGRGFTEQQENAFFDSINDFLTKIHRI